MKHVKTGSSGVRYVQISSDRDGQRLDNFLFAELGALPRSLIYRLIRTGQVRVNGGRARAMARLRAGDEVRVPPVAGPTAEKRSVPEPVVEQVRASFIAENAHFAVINKAAGLAVQGGSGLSWSLMDVLAQIGPGYRPVHRLDRPTSGLLLVARSHQAARSLQKEFAEQRLVKRYLALLEGYLEPARQRVDLPLKKVRDGSGQHRVIPAEDGQAATSHFRLLEHLSGYSYVEVSIETGRTHQIRAHAAAIGHPVVGDGLYNQRPAPAGLRRLFLHAHHLGLDWPEAQIYSAPLPDELAAALDRLRDAPAAIHSHEKA